MLHALEVGQQVAEIRSGTLRIGPDELPFAQAVERLAAAYAEREPIGPFIGAQCGARLGQSLRGETLRLLLGLLVLSVGLRFAVDLVVMPAEIYSLQDVSWGR